MAPPINRRQMKINRFTTAKLILAMLPGDLSIDELAAETGLHRITVERFTRELHYVGAAHIARREPDARGRHIIKIYKIGQGKDAPPVRLTNAQKAQRHRDRIKQQQMNAVLGGTGRFVKSGNNKPKFEEIAPCAS